MLQTYRYKLTSFHPHTAKKVQPSAAENFTGFATDWDKALTLWKRESSQAPGKEKHFETRTYTFLASTNSFYELTLLSLEDQVGFACSAFIKVQLVKPLFPALLSSGWTHISTGFTSLKAFSCHCLYLPTFMMLHFLSCFCPSSWPQQNFLLLQPSCYLLLAKSVIMRNKVTNNEKVRVQICPAPEETNEQITKYPILESQNL